MRSQPIRWGLLSVTAICAACVGDDPVSGTPAVPDAGADTSTPGPGPGPGPDASTDANTGDTGVTPDAGPARKRVFVSSSKTAAKFNSIGGIEEADKICKTLATNGGLGGTFVAWLSGGSTNAIDRVLDTDYYAVDGTTLVASGKTALTGLLKTGINRDETNAPVTGTVWTGTGTDGKKGADDCTNWSATGGSTQGRIGVAGATDGTWTDSTKADCPQEHRLYCFEL